MDDTWRGRPWWYHGRRIRRSERRLPVPGLGSAGCDGVSPSGCRTLGLQMSTGQIRLERRGRVLLVGLDRAQKRNAFDLPLWDGLCRAYGELERDPELRVGVLHALGSTSPAGSICRSGAGCSRARSSRSPMVASTAGLVSRVTKPVVIAVQGICLTLGIELMLASDIRIAARTARFGQIEIKRGIYPVGGATLRFPARSAGPTRCAGS